MRNPIRILHLEDNPRDAEVIQDKLAADGLACTIVRVDEQESFKAALAGDSFDLILCDYNLSSHDGLSALKVVREKRPATPVLVVSGTLSEEEAVNCLHQGATDYLLKQRIERLPSAVRRALQEAEEHRKRLQFEAELRESEERFRELAEHSGEVFWFCALNPHRTLYISPAVEKVWGVPAAQFYQDAHAWLTTIHPDDQASVHAAWEAVAQGQTSRFEQEYRVVRPDGSICWVLDSRTPTRNKAGRVYRLSGTARDITERKEAEQRTLRAQRIESIGTLASGIAHDLNNALAPVLMGVSVIRPTVPPQMTWMLNAMEASARHGADLVRQLLTFGKGIAGERIQVQPQRLLKEMQQIVSSTFPQNILLQVKLAKPHRAVLGDPTQLHQVLLNLCINARDAMPDGGTLTLETTNLDADVAYCSTQSEAKPGPYVIMHVADTGTGIPPEIMDHIFEHFFSTKEPGEGTGLGLATVMNIVKSHSGFIQIQSKVGQGTTFSIALPATTASESAQIDATAPTGFQGHGETVLVVDDEPLVRETIGCLLKMQNFTVLLAADGVEVLVSAAEHRAAIRLVIMDLRMPHMDGLALVRALQRMLPQVALVVISGRLDEKVERELRALKVSAILAKPFTGAQLTDLLQQVLPTS